MKCLITNQKWIPYSMSEEWQIKVSPTVIEAGPDTATYSVDVSSKAQWKGGE